MLSFTLSQSIPTAYQRIAREWRWPCFSKWMINCRHLVNSNVLLEIGTMSNPYEPPQNTTSVMPTAVLKLRPIVYFATSRSSRMLRNSHGR